MRFRSERSQPPSNTATARRQTASDHSTSTNSSHVTTTEGQVEQQFGVDISSRKQFNELQRLEQTHGQKVHEWVDEGMPREAMGTPDKMRAFRTRKATPVPWNIEARNEQSIQRSTEAAADPSSAGDASVPDSVRDVISSSGHSLDGSVQRMMEDEMGGSFGDVQIHTGATAANACDSINARAFTVGNHVAFNAGEYDPSSSAGQHVIAHELAHVRQQTGGAISMLPQEGLELEVDPDPQLEREAEETAHRVVQGRELGIQRLGETDVHVQRMDLSNTASQFTEIQETVDQQGLHQFRGGIENINQMIAAALAQQSQYQSTQPRISSQQRGEQPANWQHRVERWQRLVDHAEQTRANPQHRATGSQQRVADSRSGRTGRQRRDSDMLLQADSEAQIRLSELRNSLIRHDSASSLVDRS
jgi:hypothetical protein